jgi:Glutathione S-transferase, N-terminal domain
MIDFYMLTSPNVQKIFIMLEELGAPYRPIPVDVWKGEQFKPEFLAINPNGKIPVIVDHEGPGGKPYTVFESGAILMYLAEKFGRFLPTDAAKRYDVIQWLMIQLTGIGPTFGQTVHFTLSRPATTIPSAATSPRCCASTSFSKPGSPNAPTSAATSIPSPTSRRSRGRATTTISASSGVSGRISRAGSTPSRRARP